MSQKYKIIAIAGATCSGKTTLAQRLCTRLRHCSVLHQDDYYKEPSEIPSFNDTTDKWDDPIAIQWSKLSDHVARISSQSYLNSCPVCQGMREESRPTQLLHYVIVEGTMVLHSRDMLDLFDLSFFLTLDYETCKARRSTRTYDHDVVEFFDGHVWPMYLEMESKVTSFKPSVILLNGRRSLGELEAEISRTVVDK